MFVNLVIAVHDCQVIFSVITFVAPPVPSSCCWLANSGSVYLPAGVAKSV